MTRSLLLSQALFAVVVLGIATVSSAPVDQEATPDSLGYGLIDGPSSITTADLNGDNRPEIIVTNRYTNSVSVLLNAGNGSFAIKGRYSTGVSPSAVAACDLNRDGKQDIIIANSGSDTVSIFLGNGDGTLTRAKDYQTGAVPSGIVVADLNRDKIPDLVVVNRYGHSVSVLLGRADGTLNRKCDYATGWLPYSVLLEDVNRDGKPDLLVTSCFDHVVSMLAGNGDGSFRPKIRFAATNRSCGLLTADLDIGKLSIIEPHRYGYLMSVLLVGEGGRPEVRRSYLAGKGPSSVLAADFNHDGFLDLAVTNAGHLPGESGSVFVFLGRGNASFEAKTSYATGSASHALAVGDFNGDGKIDIAVLNGSYDFGGSVSVLFGNGDGTFGGRVDYATGGYLIPVTFGDDASGKSERAREWKEKPPEM